MKGDLPHDVVGLIGIQGRPIRYISSGSKIDAHVTNRNLARETKHCKACYQA